ncbi:MAG: DNA cytosine methyltransferase [Candidatus Peregrinibacteria bacterium]
MQPTVIEICAGGGGQSLGLDLAGFQMTAAVEIDRQCCDTLLLNRPHWNVICTDVKEFSGYSYEGIDLLAGGVPCPPFSIAGKQLGKEDERNMFPDALRLTKEIRPKAIMLENVAGFASEKFSNYRESLFRQFRNLGYKLQWKVLNACNFGVPQLRPRFILVGLKEEYSSNFEWPQEQLPKTTVGECLFDLMSVHGWKGASRWSKIANGIAPTLVGGSKKHGGPDLGPTRARKQWTLLGVDGLGIANEAPSKDAPVSHMPRLTVRMAARIQGFPDSWQFSGKKTAACRQVGNAFPPPVACAVSCSILEAISVEPMSCPPKDARIPALAA